MEGKIFFNNLSYSFTEFASISLPKSLEWAKNSQIFIKNWLNGTPHFQLQTSGSTGIPKTIEVSRARMQASAQATIDYFQLKPGTHALLCMNPDFIGGRMMMVRSLFGHWNLHVVPPTSMPITDQSIDFAAMVPLQVESLLNTNNGTIFLNEMKQLIIGGASMTENFIEKIKGLSCSVYQTFGMTETVSHIALRKLNGENSSQYYQLIGDNQIDQDDRGCLMIKGTVTDNQWIVTNDIIEINDFSFKWLGRADLVVNSGGIKIHIEPLEKELSSFFKTEIFVWKKPDEKLGERLVGILKNEAIYQKIKAGVGSYEENFKKYHFPKEWILTKNWALTKSGKIDRKQTYERS